MSCSLRLCDTFWTLPRPHLAWPSLSLIGAAWRALSTHLSHLHHRVFLAKKHVYHSESDGKHDFAMSICSELMLLSCTTAVPYYHDAGHSSIAHHDLVPTCMAYFGRALPQDTVVEASLSEAPHSLRPCLVRRIWLQPWPKPGTFLQTQGTSWGPTGRNLS